MCVCVLMCVRARTRAWREEGGSSITRLIFRSFTIIQASAVFTVGGLAPGAETSYIWLGNQWNSGLALTPPGPRNHDLLYWTVLGFNSDGSVRQVNYSRTAVFDM